jgi:hypothetical protein
MDTCSRMGVLPAAVGLIVWCLEEVVNFLCNLPALFCQEAVSGPN